MPHDLPSEPIIDNSEVLTWRDIVYPALYILGLLVLGFFIWKLLSPFLSILISALVGYLIMLRKIISGKR